MRPVLFVKADAAETFGVGPGAVVDAGAEVRVWDAIGGEPAPALAEVAGIVLFGSSFNVEHADEQPFIKEVSELTREAVDTGVPYLGVCFGAQMLAWSLDAEITKAPVREIGFEPIWPLATAADDRLLAHYDPGDHVFQWHMDTFALPDGAELLVTGDGVHHQAYRVGDRTWGVQFHFEIDRAEIETWLTAFEATEDLAVTWGKPSDEVRAEADRYLAIHQDKGRRVFERFAELAAP
jgi:GMP synthase (glutamine-hydrolysing)